MAPAPGAPKAGPGAAPAAGPGARAAGTPGGPPKMAPPRPAAAPPGGPVGTKVVQKLAPAGHGNDKPPGLDNTNDVVQLRAFAEKVRGQNLLEVLGLQKNCNAAQVKAAYFKSAKSFHPDTVPPGTPEEVGKLKAEIFAKIGEANRTLADDASRAEYIAELEAGGQGEKVDVAAILAAEEMFQKGQILVKARKFPEAVKMLDDAIKGNPEEGEYYAWRGYAKFFLAPDKKAGQVEAMKDINVCLRRNPRVADAFYFQGNMMKLTGDLVSAKKFFKQCVDLNPQHLEAQRELRMMK
jgi:tetratricopeptide (TPR) repeat protein